MAVIFTMIGIAFVAIGLVTIFLPIPLGFISLMIGIALLVASNQQFRDFIGWLRRKFKNVDKVFDKTEKILPKPLSKPLHETDPHKDEEEDEEEDEDASTPRQRHQFGAPMQRERAYPRYRPGTRPRR